MDFFLEIINLFFYTHLPRITKNIPPQDILSQMPYFALPHHPIIRAIYYPYHEEGGFSTSSKEMVSHGISLGNPIILKRGDTESRDLTIRKAHTQTAFMMSFLYIYAGLPWNALTSYMLNWVIEIFLEILAKTESAVVEGTFDPNDWFWICLYGASAAASVIQKFEQDKTQKTYWTAQFRHKLRWISDRLDVQDWNTAKRVLKSVRWEDGFDGEDEIQALWEGAKIGTLGD